jgi:hypothetical protein
LNPASSSGEVCEPSVPRWEMAPSTWSIVFPPADSPSLPGEGIAGGQAAAGSYLTGTVVSGPRFKPGTPLHGTYLSHTHLTLARRCSGNRIHP